MTCDFKKKQIDLFYNFFLRIIKWDTEVRYVVNGLAMPDS